MGANIGLFTNSGLRGQATSFCFQKIKHFLKLWSSGAGYVVFFSENVTCFFEIWQISKSDPWVLIWGLLSQDLYCTALLTSRFLAYPEPKEAQEAELNARLAVSSPW